jgi:hypothetical protein
MYDVELQDFIRQMRETTAQTLKNILFGRDRADQILPSQELPAKETSRAPNKIDGYLNGEVPQSEQDLRSLIKDFKENSTSYEGKANPKVIALQEALVAEGFTVNFDRWTNDGTMGPLTQGDISLATKKYNNIDKLAAIENQQIIDSRANDTAVDNISISSPQQESTYVTSTTNNVAVEKLEAVQINAVSSTQSELPSKLAAMNITLDDLSSAGAGLAYATGGSEVESINDVRLNVGANNSAVKTGRATA